MEEWREVRGYEGIYEVSNLGNLKSLARKRVLNDKILKGGVDGGGYLSVCLSKDRMLKTRLVHQLVAIAFLGHEPSGHKLVVNHINHNRQDNRVENLELVTQRNNANQKHLNSSSEHTGVCWQKRANKWHAQITIGGKRKHLGYFTDELEAAEAYQSKLKEITNERI